MRVYDIQYIAVSCTVLYCIVQWNAFWWSRTLTILKYWEQSTKWKCCCSLKVYYFDCFGNDRHFRVFILYSKHLKYIREYHFTCCARAHQAHQPLSTSENPWYWILDTVLPHTYIAITSSKIQYILTLCGAYIHTHTKKPSPQRNSYIHTCVLHSYYIRKCMICG